MYGCTSLPNHNGSVLLTNTNAQGRWRMMLYLNLYGACRSWFPVACLFRLAVFFFCCFFFLFFFFFFLLSFSSPQSRISSGLILLTRASASASAFASDSLSIRHNIPKVPKVFLLPSALYWRYYEVRHRYISNITQWTFHFYISYAIRCQYPSISVLFHLFHLFFTSFASFASFFPLL